MYPGDFERIVSFVAAMKSKFGTKFSLSASFGVSDNFDYNRFNLSGISNSVDFLTFVPNYKPSQEDFRVIDAKKSLQISNVQEKIENLVKAGVPTSKIVMGVNFKGFGFVKRAGDNDDDATFDKMYRYNEVEIWQPQKWKHQTDADSGLTIFTNTNNDGIIVMQNTRSIANKVRFAVKNGITGVTPFYALFDDFSGLHQTEADTFEDFHANGIVFKSVKRDNNLKYPLLHTINQAFDLTFDEIAQRAAAPTEEPITDATDSNAEEQTVATQATEEQTEATQASEEQTEATETPEEQTEAIQEINTVRPPLIEEIDSDSSLEEDTNPLVSGEQTEATQPLEEQTEATQAPEKILIGEEKPEKTQETSATESTATSSTSTSTSTTAKPEPGAAHNITSSLYLIMLVLFITFVSSTVSI